MAETDNNTGTDLKILQRMEDAWKRAHGDSAKRFTNKSLEWFRKYVPKNVKARNSQLLRDRSLWKSSMTIGKMYFFEYDAKHKATLPVWDRYPLIFPFDAGTTKQGNAYFLGINLHYLPPQLRMVAFRALLKLRNEKRYRKSTKLSAISWKALMALSNSKYFKHSVKMYLRDHVRSTFVEIPAQSWELVLFLPLARWQNASQATAWKIKS